MIVIAVPISLSLSVRNMHGLLHDPKCNALKIIHML